MGKRLLTPLGEIQIYIDGIPCDYEYEQYCRSILSLQERPLAGSYRIILTKKNWQTICCVLAPCDAEIASYGESGERYSCLEFVKDNIILTIGAGADNPAFDTNPISYGMEYVYKAPVDKVMFGIAWATDYEGQFDMRTQLATDLY